MSIKLEASDQVVVEYLHTLWNNPKSCDSQSSISQESQPKTENKYSLIQALINHEIIGNASVTKVEDCEGGADQVNPPVITEPVVDSQTTEQVVAESVVDNQTEEKAHEQVVDSQTTEQVVAESVVDNKTEEKAHEPVVAEPDETVPDLIFQVTEQDNEPVVSEQIILEEDYENIDKDDDDNTTELFIGVNETETKPEDSNKNESEESEVDGITIDAKDKKEFKKQVKENLSKIREIGFRVYQNVGLEKEVNLVVKSVTNDEIGQVYNFKVSDGLTRKNLMADIARCTVFPKYKSGDVTKPENFRYLVNHHNAVKILDRLWCVDVINSCGTNLPDKNIYKANLVKAFNGSIIETAIANTNTTDSVVLLDIAKAFDSLEWNVLEELLLNNLTRKSNKDKAKELVDQYMTIMKNRELYYNGNLISISKGISTGLPSSNLVFTLALEEILFRWFNKYNFKNNEDFVMSVYVDDIHMKILNKTKANEIVKSLINHLAEYKLNVNLVKSKVCPKLDIELPNKLSESDFYLGIPFTRDIKKYGELILSEFQKNKMNMNWIDIYDHLCKSTSDEKTSIIVGYFNYKLKPFLVPNENESSKETIKKFIFSNYAKPAIEARARRNYIIISVSMVVLAVLVSGYGMQ